MSKYDKLWQWVVCKQNAQDNAKLTLTYGEIESILGFPIDHSFLAYKKELTAYGYRVGKISMKEQTVTFEKKVNYNSNRKTFHCKEKGCRSYAFENAY